MYDTRTLDSAPRVRIAMMAAALERHVRLERIVGGRVHRALAWPAWLLGGGWRRVGAVYVELSTSAPTPADLLFFTVMRILRRPVGVYFRDAYQMFRAIHPVSRQRQRVTDVIWRVTTPLLRHLASQRFVPSTGLASALGLSHPLLLPPGTDPESPDLGAGAAHTIAYVGNANRVGGFDLLMEAMEIVRTRVGDARLRVVTPRRVSDRMARLPEWIEVRSGDRDSLADLLRDARLAVIPVRIDEYSDFAIPVKLVDYLSFGKPVVATAARETKRILESSQAGIVTADEPAAIARGIVQLLEDEASAQTMARNARAFAVSTDSTWDARARTVISELGLGSAARW